jgi:hypothetical protein
MANLEIRRPRETSQRSISPTISLNIGNSREMFTAAPSLKPMLQLAGAINPNGTVSIPSSVAVGVLSLGLDNEREAFRYALSQEMRARSPKDLYQNIARDGLLELQSELYSAIELHAGAALFVRDLPQDLSIQLWEKGPFLNKLTADKYRLTELAGYYNESRRIAIEAQETQHLPILSPGFPSLAAMYGKPEAADRTTIFAREGYMNGKQ